MSALRDTMRALGRDLANSLERTTRVHHSLTKGEMREKALRDALRPYIPLRYGLSSGTVVNLAEEQSKQQDVIISDAMYCPPFIAEGDLAMHPIEAVVATLEVKSSATPGEVANGVEKALSVAGLLPDTPRATYRPEKGAQLVRGTSLKPFSGIVALSGSSSREALLDAWAAAHVPNRPWDRSNALVVVGRFFACWMNPTGQMVALADPTCSTVGYVEAGDDAMLMFYVLMMLGIQLYPAPALNLNRYFEAADLDFPVESYAPGIEWETPATN